MFKGFLNIPLLSLLLFDLLPMHQWIPKFDAIQVLPRFTALVKVLADCSKISLNIWSTTFEQYAIVVESIGYRVIF